ncbi:MAG: hypothetical protein ACOXZ0_05250 [Eubacteriales bacterium]
MRGSQDGAGYPTDSGVSNRQAKEYIKGSGAGQNSAGYSVGSVVNGRCGMFKRCGTQQKRDIEKEKAGQFYRAVPV